MKGRTSGHGLFGTTLVFLLLSNTVSAANLTSLVNLFIGTASGANGGSGGNAFPGAAVPHAMVKVLVYAFACSLDTHDEY